MNLPKKNWIEWAVFGIGLVLIIGCFGALAADALTRTETPPQLTVTLGAPEQRGAARYVPVSVENQGDQPVTAVQVEVRGAQGEPAMLVIEALPRRSARQGEVVLSGDATAPLAGRVLGYTLP